MSCETAQQTVLLTSCYLAPLSYYALLMKAGRAVIETRDNYQKQSYRNRCHIAGANGMLSLSIPVKKPDGVKCSMKDVRIADHGNWRHLHWNAILSAYNSSPYFRYYEEDLRPFFEKRFDFLLDFNEQLRQLICRLIGIETAVTFTDHYIAHPTPGTGDFRELIHPKRRSPFRTPPYYQVFADKQDFIPDLSIVDLLFNMGNESRLILRKIDTGS